MKLAAAFALAAVSALAQNASMIEIVGDRFQVVVGETLQLRASVRDGNGVAMANAAVTWSVNQPTMATISSTGLVTTRGLGTIRVTARSGNVQSDSIFQTIPARLEVNGPQTLNVGQTAQYSAAFYDASGAVISGVPVQWSLLTERQGTSQLGRISTGGSVETVGEGIAWVWANYNYNEVQPGLQQRWVAYLPVTISAPAKYSVRRLFSAPATVRSNWTLRPKQTMIWPLDDGSLLFNASLSGIGNSIMNWNAGQWKILSAGGEPRFGRSTSALEFRTHSVTRDGRIFAYEETAGNGNEMNLGSVAEGLQPFLNNNVPLAGTEATNGLFINRASLTSTGWKMARATFRFVTTTTTLTGLFRGVYGLDDLMVHTGERLNDIPAGFTIDTDFGIAADGTAFYGLTNGTNRVFYRHTFEERKKLIGTGDQLPGVGPSTARVRTINGGRTYAPNTWFDEDGTALFSVTLDDNSVWLVSIAPDGKISSLRVNSLTGILFRDSLQGTLIYANPFNNQGNGIWLWKDGAVKAVQLFSRRLLDQTVQDVESGCIDRNGVVTLMVRGDSNALMVVRYEDTPRLLFKAGDDVFVDAPVDMSNLIGGARVGAPHLMTGGNPGSISTFTAGEVKPVVAVGERFGPATMWFGGSVGSLSSMRKAPDGDVYLTTGLGIYRVRPGGTPEQVQAFPYRVDANLTINAPGSIDINSQGDILFNASTSAGDTRICILKGGQVQQLLTYSAATTTATVLNNLTAASLDSFFLGDDGRVIAQLRFRNVATPSVAIWNGSTWTLAASVGTRIGNRTATGFPNIVRASGNRLIAGVTVETGTNILAEWTGTAWQMLVDITAVMPSGLNSNTVNLAEMNRNGDVFLQHNSNGSAALVVRRGTGELFQVQNLNRPTPDGDFLLRMVAIDFRDDGTAFFLAFNQWDEFCLYQADPV